MTGGGIKMLYIWLWNIFVFLLYGADKLCAVKNKRRVPEACLLLASAAAGGIGALSAMVMFRHKTKKTLFRIMVPVSLIITEIVVLIFDKHMIV